MHELATLRIALRDPGLAEGASLPAYIKSAARALELRLDRTRSRGGAYAAVSPSPQVARLLARLWAAEAIEGVREVH